MPIALEGLSLLDKNSSSLLYRCRHRFLFALVGTDCFSGPNRGLPATPFRFTLLNDFCRVGGLSGTPGSATREGLLSQSGHWESLTLGNG